MPGRFSGPTASTRSSKTLESCTLAAVSTTARGTPLRSVRRWCLEPSLPRSVGLGPTASPPFWRGQRQGEDESPDRERVQGRFDQRTWGFVDYALDRRARGRRHSWLEKHPTTFAACRATSRPISLPTLYLLDLLALASRSSLHPEVVFVHGFAGHLRRPSDSRTGRCPGRHPTGAARSRG
jgi:hypothetical protein